MAKKQGEAAADTSENAESSRKFGERLRSVQTGSGLKQEDFARSLDVHPATLNNYLQGKRLPTTDFVECLATKYGVSPSWLIMGVDHSDIPEPYKSPIADLGDAMALFKAAEANPSSKLARSLEEYVRSRRCDVDLIYVPMVEARISAGTGSFQTEAGSERLYAFRSDFLNRKGQPKQMVLMRVSGDSMEPEIKHGDTVLIDKSQCEPRPGIIYAVRVGELIYLKVVDALPDGLVLKSINIKYDPMKVDMRGDLADGVSIMGRVIWWCREAR